MEPRIRSKKEKILRISIALAIVTSLILSIASYYTLSTIDEIANGEDGVAGEGLVDEHAGDAHHRRAAVVALGVQLEVLDLSATRRASLS